MMKKRKSEKRFYKYNCTITGETFTTTREAKNPDDLVSVRAYYELNQEKDDRPEVIKKQQDQTVLLESTQDQSEE